MKRILTLATVFALAFSISSLALPASKAEARPVHIGVAEA